MLMTSTLARLIARVSPSVVVRRRDQDFMTQIETRNGFCRNDQICGPMGRREMADDLGLTIETVSRMLTQLQLNSIVECGSLRSTQVKNRQALSRLTH